MTLTASYGFVLLGDPVKQGDLKCVGARGTRNHTLIHSNNDALTAWREQVGYGARSRNRPIAPKGQAVELVVTFSLGRPANHWGTGRNAAVLKPTAPPYPTTAPDLDKLARAIGDALKGVAYADDAQIVDLMARKRWAHDRAATLKPPRTTHDLILTPEDTLPCPGVVIRIYPKGPPDALD
jgi:crossover junction endodeoxyribonuclease RusA